MYSALSLSMGRYIVIYRKTVLTRPIDTPAISDSWPASTQVRTSVTMCEYVIMNYRNSSWQNDVDAIAIALLWLGNDRILRQGRRANGQNPPGQTPSPAVIPPAHRDKALGENTPNEIFPF